MASGRNEHVVVSLNEESLNIVLEVYLWFRTRQKKQTDKTTKIGR